MTEALVGHLVQCFTKDHFHDHLIHKHKEVILDVFSGCTVLCGEDVTDGLTSRGSGHVPYLLLLGSLNVLLYLYLYQEPQFLRTYCSDGEGCPHGHILCLTFADTIVVNIMSRFIQRGRSRVWICCIWSCNSRVNSRSYVKVYFRPEGRAVGTKCCFGLNTSKSWSHERSLIDQGCWLKFSIF